MTQQRFPTPKRRGLPEIAVIAAFSSPVLLGMAFLLSTHFSSLPNSLRWPARFIIAGCGLLGLWKFPRESRRFFAWLGGVLVAGRTAFSGWVEKRSSRLKRAERILAICACAVALIPFCMMIRDMSWSSLRTDEITSVSIFSSQGPWHVMSNYQRANNHLLFNLLNSVTPYSDSMHPIRARFWSFVAMTALVVVAGRWLWRSSPSSAAWMSCVICLNTYHLHLELQARAYGLSSLLAFLAAAGFVQCAVKGQRKGLVLLAVATVLGTYAVPYFVVYGGLLLLWLFLERPRTERFLAGFWTLCAILLLHLPVLNQIFKVAQSYDEDYEAGFASANSAWSVLYYLVPGGLPFHSIGHSAMLMTLLLFTALLPGVGKSRLARAGLIIAATCVAFIAFCYLLESPPRRVAAFVVVPFSFGLALTAVGLFSSSEALRPWARVASPVFCAGLLAFGLWRVTAYEFEPTQRWREFGKALSLVYPSGVDIWVDTDLRNNQAYLDKRFTVTEGGEFDLAHFKAGELVVHDANYSPRTKRRIISQNEVTDEAVRVCFETSGGGTVLWLQAEKKMQSFPSQAGKAARYEVVFEPMHEPRGAILIFKDPLPDVSLFSKTGEGGWRTLSSNNWFKLGRYLFLHVAKDTSAVAVEAAYQIGYKEPVECVLPKQPHRPESDKNHVRPF